MAHQRRYATETLTLRVCALWCVVIPNRRIGYRKVHSIASAAHNAAPMSCSFPSRKGVYVIAPQDWDEQGKRQVNDFLNAPQSHT
jgi:hypothetical protein